MTKILMCDPPSGWKYGWPKEFPQELDDASEKEVEEWFLDKGYPNHLIDQGMLKHCRWWEEENAS